LRAEATARSGRWLSIDRRAWSICRTLFESAKLAGIDPHRYVLEVTRRAIASPGTVTLPEDVT